MKNNDREIIKIMEDSILITRYFFATIAIIFVIAIAFVLIK